MCHAARDDSEVVGRLLALTRDAEAGVVGAAILSLGELAAEPARVVPRLAKLLLTFEEYDPDVDYDKDMTRVLGALRAFGPDASPAVGAIATYLRNRADGSDGRFDYWRFPAEALDVLEQCDAGSAAPELLEALRAVRAAELGERERDAAEDAGGEEDAPPAEDEELGRLGRLIAQLDEPRHDVP